MRNRIFSILLCCVMLLGLLPTAVFAADAIDYSFTINGTAVTSENIGKLPGVTGTVSYDQNTKTLTLDGVTITSSSKVAIDCNYQAVEAIKLVGANEILFTAEAAVAVKNSWICGIRQNHYKKTLTIFGSSRSDSLKITAPKITEHTMDYEYPANCIHTLGNLEIRSCTLDILNPEILCGGSYSPLLYSQNGNITIKDCDLKAVLGKDRSGEINKVPIGRIVCAMLGDITITDSKVEVGVFSSSEGGTFAAIDGNNITVTGSELDLKVKVAANGDCSVRALHISNYKGKINLTDSFGTIEVGSSNQCKCFGIDIWPGAESECLTIDACTLTINILGTNMTREKEQAILIQNENDTTMNKWPIFKNISAFTYGDTADNTVTKAPGSTETGFWRKHYLKITAAPTALTLDQAALELVSGNNRTLTATVTPAHAEQNVTWTSSNESVATVVNGVVTAVRAGTATVTASTAGLSASCTVTVKEPTYTVTLHTGGGTIDSGNVTSYTYGEGATLPTADDMTYTGYTFIGWYDNEGLAGDPITAIGDNETGDKEYWARWDASTYTVTLNAGGATINSGNVTSYTYGEGATLPTADDMTYTGYTFIGWYDNEGLAGDPVTAIGDNETGDKEYWASWEINTYILTIKPENDDLDIHITGYYGDPISAPALTRDGYEFIGWDKAFPTTMPAENMTITAQWRDIAAPVINGLTDGKVYCSAAEFTVSDNDSVASVTVNGMPLQAAESGKYSILPASGEQTIIVTDKAGNETRVTVTVNDGHTYEWQSENGQYWQKCKFCGDETVKRGIPAISIIGSDKVCRTQDYKFSFTLPEGATDAAYGYEFIGLGDGPLTPTFENNLYSGIIKASTYPAEETGFKLIVSGQTADGFTFSAEKTVEIQNEHSGGTATCKDRAKCEVCGESYGEPNANNHTDLKHFPAKAATKTDEGSIEYWYCSGCGKYYKDARATQEITKEQTVTAKLPEEKPVSPATGDTSSPALWIALLLAGSGAGILTTVYGRRKKSSAE